MPSRIGMVVSFFILGVQKGGTTSAAHHLAQHPEIFIPSTELHFFDKEFFDKDYSALDSNYILAGGNRLLGEKTPSYCYIDAALTRIHEYNPDAKLIILLREPVSRAFSQWNMACQTGKTNLDFIPSIKSIESIELNAIQSNGYYALQRGYYVDQINNILTKFNKENLFIGISERIKNDPYHGYNSMLEFLGLAPLQNLNFNPEIHKRDYRRNPHDDEVRYLMKLYSPFNQRLYDYLGYEINEWEEYYNNYR